MLPTPQMTLFHSPTSPFARKVRIAVLERGLQDHVTEVIAQIRTPLNEVIPYSATGKIPALSVEDGPDKGLAWRGPGRAGVHEYLVECLARNAFDLGISELV